MGDDGKEFPNYNHPLDNSSLLTDWLFKHRLDNICYISASPSLHSQISKSARKGGIFESRDVIRPTVQLFKNIKNKVKRRNETPSPQRNKAKVSTAPSPTKECNRVFTHRGAGEDSLEVYRRIFTYGRVKQDRVSKDKIESAVALFRQREQGREASATRASAPEKGKKLENADVKAKKRTTPIKPTTKENSSRAKETGKIGDNKQRDSREEKVKPSSKEIEVEVRSRENKFIEDKEVEIKLTKILYANKVKSPNKTRRSPKKIEDNYEKVTREGKGECVEEIENQSAKINTENKIDKNNDLQNSKRVKKMNLINNQSQGEGNQLSVINFSKDISEYSQADYQSRKSLIQSLKSKYSRLDIVKDAVPTRKQISADYIIVKPVFSNYEAVSVTTLPKPKPLTTKKSVDDLLKEYRIKYRNMMKVR